MVEICSEKFICGCHGCQNWRNFSIQSSDQHLILKLVKTLVKSGHYHIKTLPGSTFKSYGLAAAIQEGAFDPDRNINLDIEILWVHVFQTGIESVGVKSQCHSDLLIHEDIDDAFTRFSWCRQM